MMGLSDYCAELMKQDFNDVNGKNYVKAIFMIYLRSHNYEIDTDVSEVAKFIYRFYIDQPDIASKSSNLIIRGLRNYNYFDIVPYLNEILESWVKQGSGVISYDGTRVKTNIDAGLDVSQIDILNSVVNAVFEQHFNDIIKYDPSINNELVPAQEYYNAGELEKYLEALNKSRFRNRAFEKINYCACCDDADYSALKALHINPHISFNDPDNSIVFCDKHAKLYLNGYFRFLKNGKIRIDKYDSDLDDRMHLSRRYLDDYNRVFFE